MSDFIPSNTRDTVQTIANDLSTATKALDRALEGDSGPSAFVEAVLALDEQISRARLILPLCTIGVTVAENGRMLSLSDLLMEIREEFDKLARAQIEVLAEGNEAEGSNADREGQLPF